MFTIELNEISIECTLGATLLTMIVALISRVGDETRNLTSSISPGLPSVSQWLNCMAVESHRETEHFSKVHLKYNFTQTL